MTTRPTDIPEWATVLSGGSDLIEPPPGKQQQGFLPFERPSSGFLNWAWNRFSDWAAHFAGVGSLFLTPQAAVRAPVTGPIVVGDMFILDEREATALAGDIVLNFPGVGGATDSFRLDSSGELVATINDTTGAGQLVERDTGVIVSTFVLTNPTGTGIQRVLFDGVDIVVGYDAFVECFSATTLLSKWVMAFGTINDLAWDATQVYLVTTTGAVQLRALDRTSGASNWTFDHGSAGSDLFSVATNGRLVFVAGDASDKASLATIRAVVAVDGSDLTNEGGNGVNLLGWNAIQGTLTSKGLLLATDGRALYVGQGDEIERRGCGDGVIRGSRTAPELVQSLSVDDRLVVAAWWNEVPLGAGGISAYEKDESIAEAWRQIGPTGGTSRQQNQAVTDGGAVFVAAPVVGGDVTTRLARGNRARRWRRLDPSVDTEAPMRQLVAPADA